MEPTCSARVQWPVMSTEPPLHHGVSFFAVPGEMVLQVREGAATFGLVIPNRNGTSEDHRLQPELQK